MNSPAPGIQLRHPYSVSSFWVRMATRMSRARWFIFLRKVFHYQNSSRSDLGSNPLNSSRWMMMELIALVAQISLIAFTLHISKSEKPVWPMRLWITGYGIGCFLGLLLLFGRYQFLRLNLSDVEQQNRDSEESRTLHWRNKCQTSLELFFAIWFVIGNVWIFDSRFGSYDQAPKLHFLCISLLSWNAICYSFPFLLFLLLCCFVPLVSRFLGYNMNMGSANRGASDEQLSRLPSWRYKPVKVDLELETDLESNSSLANKEHLECCICLAKYIESEEVRELPCSHLFHLKCVDQWLRIIPCCPLCKQEIDSSALNHT